MKISIKSKIFPLLTILSLILSIINLIMLIDSYNKIHALKENIQNKNNKSYVTIQKTYNNTDLLNN